MPSTKSNKYSKQSIVGRVRTKIWYWAVKARGNWSDYQLDMAFGQPEGAPKKAGIDRNRVFDAIRKNGTRPSKGTHHRRQFDLVERIESHNNFCGTKNVYDSLFWDVLESKPRNLDTTTELVNRCLARLNLKRLHGHDYLNWMWLVSPLFANSSQKGIDERNSNHFEFWLNDSTQHLPVDLDLLALFGAMYREACLSFAPTLAEVHSNHFKQALDSFCKTSWLQPLGEDLKLFEEITRNRILYGMEDYLPEKSDLPRIFKPEIAVSGIIISKDINDVEKYLRDREQVGNNFIVTVLDATQSRNLGKTDKQNK